MLSSWQAAPLPADLVVPVPLHPERLAARGYNQAELLADRAGEYLLKPVEKRWLKRVKQTKHQYGLTKEQRSMNLSLGYSFSNCLIAGSSLPPG